jgi:hypothetical protein
MMQRLINKKFGVNTKYNDIYHAIKMIKSSNKKTLDLSKGDIHSFIETLEDMKK